MAAGGGVAGGSSLEDILRSAAGASHAETSFLNADIQALVRAWCNEKAAPEVLPFPTALVEGLQSMLKEQEEAVAAMPTSGPDAVNPAISTGYHMDIQRVRFLLAAYHRTRLLKVRRSSSWCAHDPHSPRRLQIQRWALHVTSEPELTARLSRHEKGFAREFLRVRHGHLQDSVLAHLAPAYRALVGHERGVLDGPPLGTHVAALPLEDLGEVVLGGGGEEGGEPMDMPQGQAKILPYASVRDLLLAGKLRLV